MFAIINTGSTWAFLARARSSESVPGGDVERSRVPSCQFFENEDSKTENLCTGNLLGCSRHVGESLM